MKGYSRIEQISFEAYNESVTFRKRSRDTITGQDIIRNGYWQIRSTGREKTEGFVKAKGFGCQVQSWEGQGRKTDKDREETGISRQYGPDWSGAGIQCWKHSYGLGLIVTKLEETQLTSIALSVLTANLFKMQRRILCALLSRLRGFSEEISGKLIIVA